MGTDGRWVGSPDYRDARTGRVRNESVYAYAQGLIRFIHPDLRFLGTAELDGKCTK